MTAVSVDDSGALLPDEMRDARVIGDLCEPRAVSARLVDRDDQPALDADLALPRLAVADLLLVELPVLHAQVAARRIVHAGCRLDIGTEEIMGDRTIDTLEPVSSGRDVRPLAHLGPIDARQVELIRLH